MISVLQKLNTPPFPKKLTSNFGFKSTRVKLQKAPRFPLQHKLDRAGKLVLEDAYEPAEVEEGWYRWWRDNGYFEACTCKDKPPFTMLLPPPNVTGRLHIGHALTLSIQDTLARYYRMLGHKVSWIPGTDHAGIGTQAVVERQLFQEKKLTRLQLTREEFLDHLKAFQTQHGRSILEQMSRLGASVDWSKEFFTLDEARSRAVQHGFITLFQQGLVYRATRVVNWCPALATVLSDIEVEYESIEKPTFVKVAGLDSPVEFGVVYHIKYPLVSPTPKLTHLVVATTRPETMLGDVGLAVHPDDARYADLIGSSVHHPILNVTLPILADPQLVNMDYGTGVVKISPAHDSSDFECHVRHNLPLPASIFDGRGHVVHNPSWPGFSGLHRFEARSKIVAWLGPLFVGKFACQTTTVIPRCTRSGDIIEPMLQPQWFIRMNGMASKAIDVVRKGEIKLTPSQFNSNWESWLCDIQDWCVSRQLVWGHRIPAYQVTYLGSLSDPNHGWVSKIQGRWFVGPDENHVMNQVRDTVSDVVDDQIQLESIISQIVLKQDGDVLDTWFSSALLPLSATGWPDCFNKHHVPTDLVETGSDILFFWVARMVMLCTHLNGIPFNQVLLHPMVRDRHGRKMSKSLGNVIDPLHVINGILLEDLQRPVRSLPLPKPEIEQSIRGLAAEFPNGIPACGTDALRFTLLSYLQQGRNIHMNVDHVKATRHFVNKLWQLVRFYLNRQSKLDKPPGLDDVASIQPQTLLTKYLLSKLATSVVECHIGFKASTLSRITFTLRKLIVIVVCDTVVEFAKPSLALSDSNHTLRVLGFTIDVILRLLHPVMPYVTEFLWYHFHGTIDKQTLMLSSYPLPSQFSRFLNSSVDYDFDQVLKVVHASRSLRQSYHLNNRHQFNFTILIHVQSLGASKSVWAEPRKSILMYKNEILQLAHMGDLAIKNVDVLPDTGYIYPIVSTEPNCVFLFVPHPTQKSHVNVTKLIKQLPSLQAKLSKLESQRDNLLASTQLPTYSKRVPAKVQEGNLRRLSAFNSEISSLKTNLRIISNLTIESSSN